MSTFVLISGAWHAGWCWERVAPLLEAAGHNVLAPDLLGMGDDPTPLPSVSLSSWADQVADMIRAIEGPVILVGHSRGGIVISEVAERVPEKIDRLVYLSAFLVCPGETLFETIAKAPPPADEHALVFHEDGTSSVAPARVGPSFYNTTDPEWVDRAASKLSREPMVVFTTPVQTSSSRFGSVGRVYIECTKDNAVPLELQRRMQSDLPCSNVFTLETDHSPFYSAPQLLANALMDAASASVL